MTIREAVLQLKSVNKRLSGKVVEANWSFLELPLGDSGS